MTTTKTSVDQDYERLFFGGRRATPTHFFAIHWTEDTVQPISFAFGFWAEDGSYHQGFVNFDHFHNSFRRPVFNTRQ